MLKHQSRIIAKKGKKQVGILTSGKRGQLVTAEICVSAAGDYLPPLFVFPHQKLPPNSSRILLDHCWAQCHSSSWMTHEISFNWFVRFIGNVKQTREKPVLLILDGHTTHTQNIEAVKYARENHVITL